MSATESLTRTGNGQAPGTSWFSHPLVVSVLTPILLAIIFGALTVYMTQASALLRLSSVETTVDQQKKETDRQFSELKAEIVPRAEHEAHWKASEDKLTSIQSEQGNTTRRVDDIYKLLTTHDRR
ncbi:MAG: hypothetical protein QOD00_1811 [Blastocatellia bacterium]|jgi:hypothetical protein|nr:hypothetical protein [Blastocatellia bacterium]